MLFDLAVYLPILANLPYFLFGIITALLHLSTPQYAYRLRMRTAVSSAALLLTILVFSARFDNPTPLLTPLFFPPLALLTIFIAPLHSPHASIHPRDRLTLPLAYFPFAAYAIATPLYRALANVICTQFNPSTFTKLVCQPKPFFPRFSVPPSVIFVLPYIADDPSTVPNAAGRSLDPTLWRKPTISLYIFIPLLCLCALVVSVFCIAPLSNTLTAMWYRLYQAVMDGHVPQLRCFAHGNSIPGAHDKPRRSLSRAHRICRLVMYYVSFASFLAFAFHFSSPIGFQLASSVPRQWLCWFSGTLFHCDTERQETTYLLSRWGLRSRFFTGVVDVVRWIIMFTLPTLLLNIVGHVIFPRALWKPLPDIRDILDAGHGNGADPELGHADMRAAQLCGNKCPSESRKEAACFDTDFVLYVRYVTRGSSPRLMVKNTQRAVEILKASGLPAHMWRVEVVTDISLDLHKRINNASAYEIVVPSNYRTDRGALYKARALNYAIGASPARDQDWVVHLDEETVFDVDTVRAVLHHCAKESYRTYVAKSQKWPRIGQGPILYGRAMTDRSVAGSDVGLGNWITTLADSGRVSDDCGRYRIQYECGEVWVGMHGSFVVVANCVERDITFDHGVEGSIAEDAFFALLARSKDVRFAWVDALMFEQSPFTVKDFIKQRSRWLVGGLRVIGSNRIPWKQKPVMGLLIWLWSLMPLTYVVLFISVLFGSADSASGASHYYFHLLLPMLAALSMWNYVFGFFVTFSMSKLGPVRFCVLLYSQVLLTPIFGLMEVAAVSYALWNFSHIAVGFHVVQKDISTCSEDDGQARDGVEHPADESTRLLP